MQLSPLFGEAHVKDRRRTTAKFSETARVRGVGLGADRALVDELFLTTQPAHLQKQYSDKLTAEERDLIRADMVRERLKNVNRPVVKPTPPPSTAN